jgi:hypothetical protein
MAPRAPLRLLRLGNPCVRGILRSPAHRLLSGALVVLEYESRRTGRLRAFPLLFVEHGNSVVALAVRPEGKHWWRSFRRPARAALLVRGQRRAVVGRLLEGEERREALRLYLAARPRAAGSLGVSDASDAPQLDAAPAAVIAFDPFEA